ncbi:MAG: histidine--tRNA ligase [Phycisphaerae bacterium]
MADIQPMKGTRDFYPDQMRVTRWILDAWRRVSLRNGFEEYDAPLMEPLELFTIKSGDEIVEQLFSMTDRGGRNLAIKPEITPSLARMVAAKINSLPRPIKWFSLPRLCRAENPQRGRLREFYQWNIDIIGADDALADAECIFVAVDFLREVGLGGQDVKIHVGSRPLTTAFLREIGVSQEGLVEKVLPALDKRPKLTDEAFRETTAKVGISEEQHERICRFQDARDVQAVSEQIGSSSATADEMWKLAELWSQLEAMDIADYCRLDMRIVRGLAYYTGIVWEMFDAGESLRAVAAGGRYDNLLELLGGQKIPATGFGMGDVVLELLLREKGKLPDEALQQQLDVFVMDATGDAMGRAVGLVAELRRRGLRADFSYKRQSLGKQLKEANRRSAAKAVILGDDQETVAVKDMASGEQQDGVAIEQFLSDAEAEVKARRRP